ncbi:MAG: hypothetical protein ACYDAR_03250 [Thermomicrobiales bacterium]
MKFQRTQQFLADYKRLSDAERALFLAAVRQINDAYARRGNRRLPNWPATLRIGHLTSVSKVWEMTWSFSGPDGRATFEFVTIDGESAILWRRIGDHGIFSRP